MDAEDQDQEYSSTDDGEKEEEGAEPPIDQLIHTKEMLQKVLVPLQDVRMLLLEQPNQQIKNRLIGCMMICTIRNKKIIDEVEHVTQSSGIKFKHSPKSYPVEQLQHESNKIGDEEFSQWVDQMAAWQQLLPLFAVYKKRRNHVQKSCVKAAKKQDEKDKSTRNEEEKEEEEEKRTTKRKRKRGDEEESKIANKNPKMTTTSKEEESGNSHRDEMEAEYDEEDDEEEPEEEEAHMEQEIETTDRPSLRKRIKLEAQDDDDVQIVQSPSSAVEAPLTPSNHPTSSTPSLSKLKQATVLFTEFVGDDLWMRFFDPDSGRFQQSHCCNKRKIKNMKPGMWAQIEYQNCKGGQYISITHTKQLNGSTNKALNTAMQLVYPAKEGAWTLLLKTRHKKWSVPDLLATMIVEQIDKNASPNSNTAPSLPSTPKRRPSISSETASNSSHGVKAAESPKIRPAKREAMEKIKAEIKKRREGNDVRETFRQTFGADLMKILVDPRQLVQLLQLGHEEFKRIATGLFVRFTMFDKGTKKPHLSLGQIRTVTFDSRPYTVYDQELNVKFHLENSTYWFTILHTRFGTPEDEKQLLGQPELIDSFIRPTAEFVAKKWAELRAGLNKTVRPKGKIYPGGPKQKKDDQLPLQWTTN